jgi:hypothetical protein
LKASERAIPDLTFSRIVVSERRNVGSFWRSSITSRDWRRGRPAFSRAASSCAKMSSFSARTFGRTIGRAKNPSPRRMEKR